MIVYTATNTVNGMQYVGAAKCFKSRLSGHLSDARRGKGCGGSIQDAIRTFGPGKILFEVVDHAESYEELSEKEIDWIDRLNSLSPNGYNLLRGNYATRLKNSFKHVSITVSGREFPTINSAAEFHGIGSTCFRGRLERGWTPEQAAGIDVPPENYGLQKTFVPITIDGVDFRSKSDAARHFGVNMITLNQRLKKGWTPEQAAGLEPAPYKKYAHPFMRKIVIRGREFDSQRQAIQHYSKKLGVKARTLKARFDRGWSWDDVLSSEVSHRHRVKRKPRKTYVIGGKTYGSSFEVAEAFGIPPGTVRLWIFKNKDKSLDEIFLNRRPPKTYVIGGKVYKTSKEVGEALGLSASNVRQRISSNKDKTLDEIFSKETNQW